jgi:hypothetical protein
MGMYNKKNALPQANLSRNITTSATIALVFKKRSTLIDGQHA